MDIDHIVPLKEAHISGAHKWSRKTRRQFANDAMNLIVVSARANRSKGAKDPAHWLPPNKEQWCKYVFKWVKVKEKYKLNYDRNEINMIKIVNNSCK